jgi:glycosyltransferase involved in cell wall biosynthesis
MLITYIIYADLQGLDINKKSAEKDSVLKSINSVTKQSIPNWELIVITFNKKDKLQILGSIDLSLSKIKKDQLHFIISKTKSIGLAFKSSLKKSSGKFIVTISPGDEIASHTTYELIKKSFLEPEIKIIYTDHDDLSQDGKRKNPVKKPPYSFDLIHSQNYMGPLTAINVHLLGQIKNSPNASLLHLNYENILHAINIIHGDNFSNSQNHSIKKQIGHIPLFLYHKHIEKKIDRQSKNEASEKITADPLGDLISRSIKKYSPEIKIQKVSNGIFNATWPVPSPSPLVTLIIPTKDQYSILKVCIDSILKKTTYENYELLIIDNQSTEKKTLDYLDHLKRHNKIRVLKYPHKFNYSAINNYAARCAKGEILGFINNDTEVISKEWLSELVGHAIRPDIGCVGALLLYPDKTIQHAGVTFYPNGHVHHEYAGLIPSAKNDPHGFLRSLRNPPAVTGAAMVIEKFKFMQVGGFNSRELKVAFNDVELCIKLTQKGFINVWTPKAKLIHHESKTRGRKNSEKEIEFIINFVKKSYRNEFQCYSKI